MGGLREQGTGINEVAGEMKPRRSSWGPVIMAGLGIGLLIGAVRPMIPFLARPAQLVATPSSLTVNPETPAEHQRDIEITLSNPGDAPLTIESVTSSCGCTQITPLDGITLGPGESRPLKARVQLAVGNGKSALIRVRTNSEKTPELTIPLQLGGKSLGTMFVSQQPELIILRGTKAGAEIVEEFEIATIEPPESNSPLLKSIASDLDGVKAEVVHVGELEPVNPVQSRRTFRLRLTAKTPDNLHDTVLGRLEVVLAQPVEGLKSIPFKVVIEPPVRFVPEQVVFQLNPETKFPLERTVIVRGEPTLEILEVQSSDVSLEAAVLEAGDPGESRMAVVRLRLLRAPDAVAPLQVMVKTMVPDTEERSLAVLVGRPEL